MTSGSALENFRACGWDAVAMDRADILDVELTISELHPGGAIVSSCQRTEAYQVESCSCGAPGHWQGRDAVLHLAEVASGLHSIVLGEDQILGQARAGFDGSRGQIRAMGDVAFAAARELRGRTQFNSHAGALLDKALKFARTEPGGRILVLGPGQMGRLLAKRAEDLGYDEIILAGRALPVTTGPKMHPALLTELESVGPVAAVVGCLGSAAAEIDLQSLPPAPLVLDLGTPKNFIGSRAGTSLVRLEELIADEASRPHSMARRHALQRELAAIVDRRLARWVETGASAIGRIRTESERIRREEVARMMRLHPEMDRVAIEAMSHALVNRLMHGPTEQLRDDPGLEEAALKMFSR